MRKQIFLFFLLLFPLTFQGQNRIKEELPSYIQKGNISLRTNVIQWIILDPNIGIEYNVSNHIGLIAEFAWGHWNMNIQNRYWRMWNLSPQGRYYMGENKHNYIGIQYSMGEYNLNGIQGKFMGGGLTIGHYFYVSKNIFVDLGLSLGYLNLYEKEEYKRIGGHNYQTKLKTSSGYWGPTGLSMTFVWKIN